MCRTEPCVDIQCGARVGSVPIDEEITAWVHSVLQQQHCSATVSIRFVDEVEMVTLNERYRNQAEPTNVLSFPCDRSDEAGVRILGDIVACEPVVTREALAQGKDSRDHWAHIIIHGLLHLLDFDHMDDREAAEMEQLEIQLLSEMGIGNPYADRM